MEKSTTKEKNTKAFNKKENHQKTLNYKQAGSTVSKKKGRSLMLNKVQRSDNGRTAYYADKPWSKK